MIVTVAAAFGRLEVVALRGLDAAEARAAAHHIENHCREPCSCHIGDALLLQ